jgi:N-acetylglucosamine transport system permease protein
VGSALFGTLLLSAMAAYGLARLRVRGRLPIYYVFVAGMIVPTALTLAPLFGLLRSLSLLNSLTGLALVYVAFSLPFSVLMLHGFFASLPEEVREAAIVDGASEWQTFWHVFLPMARPGLVTVAIFNFLGMWNEYLLALVILIEPEKQTMQLGIANMVVALNYRSDWGTLLATMVLAMLPVLVLYAALHKKVVEGMILGAVKG